MVQISQSENQNLYSVWKLNNSNLYRLTISHIVKCDFITSLFHVLNMPNCFFTSDPVQDNKKNTKRREVDNKQLKKVLSGVIEHVRIGHVLPPHSELLESVFRRGLADRGMPLDIGEGSFYPNLPWMRRREERDFVRPRLFLPYFEEAKVRLLYLLLSSWVVCIPNEKLWTLCFDFACKLYYEQSNRAV